MSWHIDIDGVQTHEAAARKALHIQRDPNSIATVFEVRRSDLPLVRAIDITEIGDVYTSPTSEVNGDTLAARGHAVKRSRS